MLAAFLIGSCVAKILSVSLAGRLAGFRGLDLIDLALTTNARGGPGIVLDVALDPGIISNELHTTFTAGQRLSPLRSPGAWLDYVSHKGWHCYRNSKQVHLSRSNRKTTLTAA